MPFTFRLTAPPDGDALIELNEAGIDYLIDGLEALRTAEPGDTLRTPSLTADGVQSLVLQRAED